MIGSTNGQASGNVVFSYPISTGSVSCANNTKTVLCTLSLPKGISIVQFAISFNSNATGYRKAFLSTASDLSSDIGIIGSAMSEASSVGDTVLNATCLVNNTSSSSVTYYLGASQNSGSTLSAYPRVKIVTIKA